MQFIGLIKGRAKLNKGGNGKYLQLFLLPAYCDHPDLMALANEVHILDVERGKEIFAQKSS